MVKFVQDAITIQDYYVQKQFNLNLFQSSNTKFKTTFSDSQKTESWTDIVLR